MAWNLQEAIGWYQDQGAPGDQSALTALLREIQQESGGAIPLSLLRQTAEALEVKESFLQAVVKRMPSLRLADTHTLELCGGPNCSKRADLWDFFTETYGEHPENILVKRCGCMHLCAKGPNLKWDGKIFSGADKDLLRRLMEQK